MGFVGGASPNSIHSKVFCLFVCFWLFAFVFIINKKKSR